MTNREELREVLNRVFENVDDVHTMFWRKQINPSNPVVKIKNGNYLEVLKDKRIKRDSEKRPEGKYNGDTYIAKILLNNEVFTLQYEVDGYGDDAPYNGLFKIID